VGNEGRFKSLPEGAPDELIDVGPEMSSLKKRRINNDFYSKVRGQKDEYGRGKIGCLTGLYV
jgi:hypothetical protein